MECEECGAEYRPMTDAYRCPECGTENYPPDEQDEYEPYRVKPVYTNCNVCGIVLRADTELLMGLCDRCADE